MTTAVFALISVALHLLFLKTPSLDFFSTEKKQEMTKPNKPHIQVSLRTLPRPPVINQANNEVKPRPKNRDLASHAGLKKQEKIKPIPEETPPIVAPTPIPEKTEESQTTAVESAIISNEEGPKTELSSEFSLYFPDSAELLYEVERIEKSNSRITGNAKLNWKVKASYYSITMEVQTAMLFTNINLYTMKSEGELNHLGLRPKLASEKRFNRSETATHFDSKAATILFSSSNQKVAMQGVAQDRSSLLLQLASAVKSDATQFTPGRIFSMQVGEDRAAINYVFEVVGTEKITTKLGTFDALHLVRKPLSGSYQAQLDLWFAPELGGYPIQIRNIEGNGNITTQTLSQLQTFPSQES